MRVRYYEPGTGRFISEDPAHDGLNWYGYSGGDPVEKADPSGKNAQGAGLVFVRIFITAMQEFLDARRDAKSHGEGAIRLTLGFSKSIMLGIVHAAAAREILDLYAKYKIANAGTVATGGATAKLNLDVLQLGVLIILAIDAIYFLCIDTVFDMALEMMCGGSKEDK